MVIYDKDVILSGDDYKIQANTLDADRSFKLLKTGQLNNFCLMIIKKHEVLQDI